MRYEKDSLGEVEIEDDKFWGASTQRNLLNYSIGEDKLPLEIIYSYAVVKKASAIANFKLNLLSREKKDLIVFGAEEIINKEYDSHFPLHVWQTGSGTPTNMNINEVICNIAAHKLNKPLGSKDILHPNDDVNMSQSTNDTFPSAINIASYFLVKNELLKSLENLKKGFADKALEFKDIVKVGRTHLMDAVPMTLGQEFSAFSSSISEAIENIEFNYKKFLYLPIGATAVGTGVNAHKDYSKIVIDEISQITKENFLLSDNFFHSLSLSDSICSLSSSLSNLATSLYKIANDLSLLASGPRCAIGEIILPSIEPGSSIMPGKINPGQCESLKMVCMQVMSNDNLISLANMSGNFQLNVYRTIKAFTLIKSIKLLSQVTDKFLINCLKDIKPNIAKMKENFDKNLQIATILDKKIGYEKAAKIVFKANKENKTIKQATLELNFLDEKEFDKIVDPKKMLGPYS